MTYNIQMGIPEMAELWNRLQTGYREGTDWNLIRKTLRTGHMTELRCQT